MDKAARTFTPLDHASEPAMVAKAKSRPGKVHTAEHLRRYETATGLGLETVTTACPAMETIPRKPNKHTNHIDHHRVKRFTFLRYDACVARPVSKQEIKRILTTDLNRKEEQTTYINDRCS